MALGVWGGTAEVHSIELELKAGPGQCNQPVSLGTESELACTEH